MMDVTKKVTKIAAFMTGKLSPSAENEFRDQLDSDSELQAMYEQLKNLNAKTKKAEEVAVYRNKEFTELEQLSETDKVTYALKKLGLVSAEKKPSVIPKVRQIYTYASAAAVAILLIAGWVFLRPPSTEQLIADSYVIYSPASTMGSTNFTEFAQVLEPYRSGNYRSVVNQLDVKAEPTVEEQLLLAHSYFQLNNFDRSAALFSYIASTSSKYEDEASWNAAIAHLHSDPDSSIGRDLLNAIATNNNHLYQEKAKELLGKI